MAKQKLYICCTNDKYELPLMVSPSVKEIAKFGNVKEQTVHRIINNRYKKGIITRFDRVTIDTEQEY